MDSPTPTDVNEVLEEAAVISVIEDPSNQDELIERFQKILNKSIQTKANAMQSSTFILVPQKQNKKRPQLHSFLIHKQIIDLKGIWKWQENHKMMNQLQPWQGRSH